MGITDGSPVSALALCWRVERCDGAGLALTSHDCDITHGGIAYRAEPGLLPSAIGKSAGMDVTSAEVAGALRSEALTENDLLLGRWDHSRVTLSALDWGGSGTATMLLQGTLGEASIEGDSFTAELRGAASRLAAEACPSTSPECRASLGDKKCRVDLAGRTTRMRVLSSSGTDLQVDAPVDERFLFGRLRYLSGANCGIVTAVLAADGDRLRVRDLPQANVEPCCEVEVREGCDKRFETCASRFSNAVNFRGEPHLPGNDLLTRYPGA